MLSVSKFLSEEFPSLVGEIKMLPNGSVKVLAQGNIEDLKSFYRFLTQEEHGHVVRSVEKNFVEVERKTFDIFQIF